MIIECSYRMQGEQDTHIRCIFSIKKKAVAYDIKDCAFEGTGLMGFIVENSFTNPHDILIMDNCNFIR